METTHPMVVKRLFQRSHLKTYSINPHMARLGLGKRAERGNYFLKPKFGSSLPALMFSVCRGQAVRAGEENANILESAQNLFSEEPTECVILFSLIVCWGRGKAACHDFNC